MGYNVAIDGPAGAGKSTIAKLVAKECEKISTLEDIRCKRKRIHLC